MATLKACGVRRRYHHEPNDAPSFVSKRIKSDLSVKVESDDSRKLIVSPRNVDKNSRDKDFLEGEGSFGCNITNNHGNTPTLLSGDLTRDLEEHKDDCPQKNQQLKEPSTYRLKFLSNNQGKRKYEDDPEKRRMFARELAIICPLSHENVIKIHAVSSIPGSEPYVIIDQIVQTVEEKIKEWRQNGHKSDLRDRLCIFHALSSALDLLHENHIIYRGLDPCRVGFDADGIVKLLDFSFSKQLPEKRDSFSLTAMAGSLLYIAPENHRGEEYGFSVDVFSLCILAWEILTLEHICCGDKDKYFKSILCEGQRPEVPAEWPLVLKNILRYGWAKKPSIRPTAKVIHTALDQHLYTRSFDSPNMDYIQCMLLSNGTFLEL